MSKKLWEFISFRKFLFIFGEAILIYLSVVIASYFIWNIPIERFSDVTIFFKALLIVFIVQSSFYLNDLYEVKKSDSTAELCRRVGRSFGGSCIILAILYIFFPFLMIGSSLLIIVSLILLSFLIATWRILYGIFLRKKIWTERTVLIGIGKLSHDIAKEIISREELTYDVVGIATNRTDPQVPKGLEGREVKQGFEDLYEFIVKLRATTVIIAIDERRGVLPIKELLKCKTRDIQILDGIEFYENITGKLIVERINPAWMIFSEGFKTSVTTRILKRALDFACAFFGLIILSPLILLTAILIRLESPGPVFFKQERIGRDEVPFVIYKFRSMRQDAEDKTGPVWAQKEDPRITLIGNFIRKTRIDEIPQLWNVLKGDMSIVGPRPERDFFVQKLEEKIPYYAQRFAVKPGLTGWAQILYSYGSTEEDAAEKLRLELYYIKNMSLLMDFLIILATFKIVILRRGQ